MKQFVFKKVSKKEEPKIKKKEINKFNKQRLKEYSGLLNTLAPQALEFLTRSIEFGDQKGRIMVITDYPPRVGAAWLSRIAAIPGVITSMHVIPTDPTHLIDKINRSAGELKGRLEHSTLNTLLQQRTEQALNDAETLLRKIDLEQQNVFNVVITLMILAPNSDILDRRTRQVEASLSAVGMRARTLIFRQEDGLKAVGPWGILPKEVHDAGRRNMSSETVAASFPFTALGIKDGTGIVFGRDRNGGLVLIDIWRKEGDRTNSNMTVLAKPGAGKSFTVKMILLREWTLGSKVIIIDPEREYRQLCKELGGTWINCIGGKGRINPLQVRAYPKDSEDSLDDNEEELVSTAKGPLALHLRYLRTFFSLYLKDLTEIEKAVLEKALIEVYESKGITWDTDITSISAEDWPIMTDLYQLSVKKAKEDPKTWGRLEVFLERLATGADAALWNGHTTVEINSDFIVLDVHDLQNADDNVRRAQYFNVVSYAWNIIEQDRQERIILAVDEAWLLCDPETPQALAFLRETSKRIRKYSGSLIVISQNVVDFLDPAVARHGQPLLDNPCYKFLLGQGENDLKALSELMKLSEAEQELLSTAKRGEGLLVAGNQRIHLKIEAAPHEFALLTGGGQ